MSEGYIVEIGDEAVGIVVRQDGERCFRFHASVRAFQVLDGKAFDGPASAHRAARALADARKTSASLEAMSDAAPSWPSRRPIPGQHQSAWPSAPSRRAAGAGLRRASQVPRS